MARAASITLTVVGKDCELYVDSHCQVVITPIEQDRMIQFLLLLRNNAIELPSQLELHASRR